MASIYWHQLPNPISHEPGIMGSHLGPGTDPAQQIASHPLHVSLLVKNSQRHKDLQQQECGWGMPEALEQQ